MSEPAGNAIGTLVVGPRAIEAQRAEGWPDMHPEEYCHACGTRNIHSWSVSSDLWNALDIPEGILCPQCFTERWALTFGACTWMLRPDPDTLP